MKTCPTCTEEHDRFAICGDQTPKGFIRLCDRTAVECAVLVDSMKRIADLETADRVMMEYRALDRRISYLDHQEAIVARAAGDGTPLYKALTDAFERVWPWIREMTVNWRSWCNNRRPPLVAERYAAEARVIAARAAAEYDVAAARRHLRVGPRP